MTNWLRRLRCMVIGHKGNLVGGWGIVRTYRCSDCGLEWTEPNE